MEQMTSIQDFIPINYGQVLRNSFLISCDMAHAVGPDHTIICLRTVLIANYPLDFQVNPLYEGRYQDQHKPQLNGGVVIKMNANQRYTSNPATTFALRRLAEMSGVPMQEFEVRNDSSCGSTVSCWSCMVGTPRIIKLINLFIDRSRTFRQRIQMC